jgi:predicted nucleic acid-binding protein
VILLLDASAAVDLLLRSGPGEQVRRFLLDAGDATLVTVAHLDAEVLSALARLHRAGVLPATEVGDLLARLGAMAVERVPITPDLLSAAWSLRDTVAGRDALYVAAAHTVDGRLLTTDDRLARAVPETAQPLP